MQSILAVLPFAIGSAVSPLILTASIFAVSEPKRPLAKSLAYLAGAAVSISIIGSAIILLNLGAKRVATTPSLVDIGFSLLAGIVLLYFAAKQIFQAKSKANRSAAQGGSVGKYYALGFGLMLANTSTIILYFPAAVVLTHDAASVADKLAGLAMMVCFSLVPAAIAPLMLVILGDHAKPVLDKLSGFVKAYGRYIIAALFGLIGIYLVIKSAIELTHVMGI